MRYCQDRHSNWSDGPPGVSVVFPVYNNSSTLAALWARTRLALADRRVEIIMVNDCSTDDSLAVMRGLDVVVVDLAHRIGQNGAIIQGLAAATQPTTCVMDADLQDPPEAAPAMLDALVTGEARVVFSSRDAPPRFSSRLFRYLIRRIFRTLPATPCLCFAVDAASREELVRVAVQGDYVVALIGALRLKTSSVGVRRAERPDGNSAYTGLMRIRYAVRMLGSAVSLSLKPPRPGQCRHLFCRAGYRGTCRTQTK